MNLHVRGSSSTPRIHGTTGAFCALSPKGVHCWGAPEFGGDASAVEHRLQGVTEICATDYAFAALTPAGVVAWGDEDRGGAP